MYIHYFLSQLNSILCMYKGCNITKYIANTFLRTTPFSNNLLQGSYLPKKKSEQMFVISHYFGPNSFGKPESFYIYGHIYSYTSNTMTPIDFMCWERAWGCV